MFFRRKKKPKQEMPRPRDDGPTQAISLRDHPLYSVSIDTAAATHIGSRQSQQDSVFVTASSMHAGEEETWAFGIVCDGMGGMQGGEKASALVTEYLAKRFTDFPPDADIAAELQEAIRAADEQVTGLRGEHGGPLGAGTTLVMALIRGGKLRWASVGDSRIYILRAGEIECLTRDHNYSLTLSQMVQSGAMSEEQARAHPDREALISYIGMGNPDIIDIARNPLPLRNDDIILLCSDGLTRTFTPEEILAHVREGKDLHSIAQSLPLQALEKRGSGQDNTSVVLLRYRTQQKGV